jgi:drug/metabolite transporter (DMT)-like permease
MESVGPFTYNAVRFTLGAVSLLPLLAVARRRARRTPATPPAVPRLPPGQQLLKAVLLGVLLFGGSTLQQIGIVTTTAGKAGFITGLYVVLVPLVGGILGRVTEPGRWAAAILAAVGLYFLSMTGTFQIAPGDGLVMLCALFFAAHVLFLSYVSPRMAPIVLSLIQYAVTAVLSAVFALTLEDPRAAGVLRAWLPIAYGGVFSVGIAYSLQVVAQKNAHPAHAAIILSLEGVFAAIGGYLVLGEVLTPRGIIGGVLMVAGMLVSQWRTLWATVDNPGGSQHNLT